jgi:hypothetical protein
MKPFRFRLALNIIESSLAFLMVVGFMLTGADELEFSTMFNDTITRNDILMAKWGQWTLFIAFILLVLVCIFHYLKFPDSFGRKKTTT